MSSTAAFTIGCDPEIFVAKDGVLASAHGWVKGTKKEPEKVEAGAVQVDGMALEINITPVPYTDFVSFDKNINTVLDKLVEKMPEASELVLKPSVTFPDAVMAAAPAEALELGCDPDFNAWMNGAANPRPDAATNIRAAGGHIHVGWRPQADIPADHEDHIAICCEFIKTLDMYAGLAGLVIDPDPVRRNLYGKAGAFRPKPYGVEYRTPSNMWLKTRATRSFMFSCVRKAIDAQVTAKNDYDWFATNYPSISIEQIINNGDVAAAKNILTKTLGVVIPSSVEGVK